MFKIAFEEKELGRNWNESNSCQLGMLSFREDLISFTINFFFKANKAEFCGLRSGDNFDFHSLYIV